MLRLNLVTLAIPEDQAPDWDAAAAAIDNLPLEELAGMVSLLEDVPEVRDAINPYDDEDPRNLEALPLVKEQLLKDLAVFRQAVEQGADNLLARKVLDGKIIYICGGMGEGLYPINPLHGAAQRITDYPLEFSAAEAAGFEIL